MWTQTTDGIRQEHKTLLSIKRGKKLWVCCIDSCQLLGPASCALDTAKLQSIGHVKCPVSPGLQSSEKGGSRQCFILVTFFFSEISWEQCVQLLPEKIANSYWHHQPLGTWFPNWHKGWQIHINSSQQMDYKYSPSQLPPDRTVLESSSCRRELSTLNLPTSMYQIKHTPLWSLVDAYAVAQHGLDQKLLVPSTRQTSHYCLSQDSNGRKERGMGLTGWVGVLVMQLPQLSPRVWVTKVNKS